MGRSGATSRTSAPGRSSTTSPGHAAGTDPALEASGPYDGELLQKITPCLALFLGAWTVVVARRVPSDNGLREARRRVAYAREM